MESLQNPTTLQAQLVEYQAGQHPSNISLSGTWCYVLALNSFTLFLLF